MYKTNRRNHDFQIAYFLAGSCHTPDAAYSLLCDLKEDRELAISNYNAGLVKQKVRILKAKKLLKSEDEIERLEGEAELAEIESFKSLDEKNYNAALAELSFINKCIEKIQPHRKFSHLSDMEAHQAAQHDEWKYELLFRAENFLLTTGSIPTDHFATMRQHPDFNNDILPHITTIQTQLKSGKKLDCLNKPLDLPKLMLKE